MVPRADGLEPGPRRGWALVLVGLAAVLLVFATKAPFGGPPSTGGAPGVSSGDWAAVPTSLADLVATSRVVVLGQVVSGPSVETVSFGQSSPLGEKQTVHDLTLDIATYEVRVERCLVGACPPVVGFKEAVNHENAPLLKGARALFFLTPAVSEWGTPGLASYYGREGVLVAQDSAVVALAPGGGKARDHLSGRSLEEVASEAALLARRGP